MCIVLYSPQTKFFAVSDTAHMSHLLASQSLTEPDLDGELDEMEPPPYEDGYDESYESDPVD